MAFLYNPGTTTLHPESFLFHSSDTSSLLFFKINTLELYYNVQNKEFFNKARIQIHYRILDSENKNELIDSSTVYYFIPKNTKHNKFMTYIPIHTGKLQKYTLEVVFMDYFRHRGNQKIISFNKGSVSSRHNFFLTSKQTKEPYFENVFSDEDEVRLRYTRKKIDRLFIKYYKKEYSLPQPPFVIKKHSPLDVTPDSMWTIPYSDTTLFQFTRSGLYFFQTDTSNSDGMALFNFGKHFPLMKTAEDIMKPIKYLTTKKKYEELKNYDNAKIAVDDFWLNATGNINKSKELIRIYYNRIQLTNLYFSSYKEGWKTDRGMIYTIFGPPGTIYKAENMEKWIYGDRPSNKSLNFIFEKRDNIFSDNDYHLIRNDLYKTIWFQAIDVWRKGKVYSVEDD